MKVDDFLWLLNWFRDHCDGDWEHGSGIHIDTLDNPGWSISINLEGTELEGVEFKEIQVDRSDIDWFICFIKNGKFEGRCGISNFPEILSVFRKWVDVVNN